MGKQPLDVKVVRDAVRLQGVAEGDRMEERMDDARVTMYRGFAFRPFEPAGWEYVDEWSDGQFRLVYCDRAQLSILTYVEGDLVLEVFDDQLAFRNGWARAERFYRSDRSE